MANMNFGVNILPKANNTYSLGNSDYKWNIFANSINGTAIGNIMLPAVTSSNNGQILQVSNGVWVAGAAPSGLPSITSSDNGKVLQVSSGTWVAATLSIPTKVSDLTNDSGFLTSVPTMVGATSSAVGTAGLAPAPTSADVDKFLAGDGTYKSGGLPMVILSYGSSTWAQFEAAYNNNVIVYCRASSNSNPASGSQTRMAFMAYVNNATTPTEVEFQYYRSMSSHSATAMGDQVFVYKLNKTGGWSVTTRDASIKEINVASGSKLGVSWSSNKVTLSNTMTADDMPMSSSDATTAKTAITSANEAIANVENIHELTTVSTQFDLESAFITFIGTMADKTARNVKIHCSASFGEFISGIYQGTIYRWASTRAYVELVSANNQIFGSYISGSWGWNALALDSKKANIVKGNLSAGGSTTVTVTRPAFVSVGRAANSATSTTALIDGWSGIIYISNNTAYGLSMSGDNLTITNNSNSYINYVVIY